MQITESKLMIHMLEGYVLRKQRKVQEIRIFFLVEKNRNYKTNFCFAYYIVLRVILHCLAIEWNWTRVGIFMWYLGMCINSGQTHSLLEFSLLLEFLEEMKLVCSITIPRNLWGFLLHGDRPLSAPSLIPSPTNTLSIQDLWIYADVFMQKL